jgi:ATP-dependent RNA helicase DDX3X
VEVSEGCPAPLSEFTVESIGEQLLKNVILSKYVRPTPVQKYSIPIGLAGGDMMACAQTGSGKTGGFLFPAISIMLKKGALPEPVSSRGRCAYPSALILAPTRELASQIYDEAQKFCYCTGIAPVVVYGGNSTQTQQSSLERGVDLLVATPGRLIDLMERGRIKLDCIQFLILDEADRMLDMGFEPQIRRIVIDSNMPLSRQTFMFSATFPVEIQRLAGDFMKDYIFLAVGRVGAASKDVTQKIEWMEQHDKPYAVLDFLSIMKDGLVLIFVETKRGADHLENLLCERGIPAISIHGDKSQHEREDALKQFKCGHCPVLVATDVAARGLDIPNVTQVINFDLPSNIDDYVHRIGRTGRVGNVGHALSFMNDKNANIAKELAVLLVENEQECPEWLERMSGYGGRGGGGRGGGRGRGSKSFGARDARRDGGGGGGGGGGGRGGGWAPAGRGGPPMPQSGGSSSYGRASNDNSAW